MMPPPGLWLPVTLAFDLLTPEVDHSKVFPTDHLCLFASKLVHLFLKYRDGRTNKQTG